MSNPRDLDARVEMVLSFKAKVEDGSPASEMTNHELADAFREVIRETIMGSDLLEDDDVISFPILRVYVTLREAL